MSTNNSLSVHHLLLSGFTSNFWFYDYYYIIPAFILSYHLCSIPLISCSYYIIPCIFSAWYHLLSLCRLLYACAYDTVYNTCLWLGFIDTRVPVHARHLASPYHSLGSSDSLGSSCLDCGSWSLWILPVADQSGAVKTWIIGWPSEALSLQVPCSSLEFSFCDSWARFVQFIIVYLFVFSHLCHFSDVIFL